MDFISALQTLLPNYAVTPFFLLFSYVFVHDCVACKFHPGNLPRLLSSRLLSLLRIIVSALPQKRLKQKLATGSDINSHELHMPVPLLKSSEGAPKVS